MHTVTGPELAVWLADTARAKPLLLDVREPWEFETCHLQDSLSIPMSQCEMRLSELEEDRDRPIVCICHHGMRSMQIAAFLERHGFTSVANLAGGIHEWALLVDNTMPTY